MNNKVYLVRFNGGAGGDFLSYQISKDTNFYSLKLISSENNTWDVENSLQNLDPSEMDLTVISNRLTSLFELIESNSEFQDRNVLIRTHYTGSFSKLNIPNLSIVNLTMFGKIVYLSYFLLFIKRYLKKIPNSDLQENINFVHSGFNIDNQKEKIIQKGFCYSFERHALMRGLLNSYDFIESFFIKYKTFCLPKTNAVNFNVGKLYQDPQTNVIDFSKVFNMKNSLDPYLVQNYFEENMFIFYNQFSKYFDAYNSDKEFIDDLTNFVKSQAPDSYSL